METKSRNGWKDAIVYWHEPQPHKVQKPAI
jgi:hypothetical protein